MKTVAVLETAYVVMAGECLTGEDLLRELVLLELDPSSVEMPVGERTIVKVRAFRRGFREGEQFEERLPHQDVSLVFGTDDPAVAIARSLGVIDPATDQFGIEITCLAAGATNLGVDAEHLLTEEKSGVVRIPVRCLPRPTGTIRGTVTEEGTGAPRAEVTVTARRLNGTTFQGMTDASGRYEIANLPPDVYAVDANCPPIRSRGGIDLDAGETETVDFTCPPASAVRRLEIDPDERTLLVGEIALFDVDALDAAGRPVAGAGNEVVVSSTDERVVVIEDVARFGRAEGLALAASATIRARAVGLGQARILVRHPPSGASTGADVRVVTLGRIVGTVREEGTNAPKPEVTVTVKRPNGSVVGSAMTNAAGSYSIPVLPGTYNVEANCPPVRTQAGVVVGSGEEKVVDFTCPRDVPPTGGIVGTVTEEGTNAPRAGVEITVKRQDGTTAGMATTGADGIYAVAGLPPGTYNVEANCPPVRTRMGVVVNAGTFTPNVDFQCPRPAQAPTGEQIQGQWMGERGTRTATGDCTDALPGTWSGAASHLGGSILGMIGPDPEFSPPANERILGPYDPATGRWTGTGTKTLANGFRIETTIDGTFSFDASGNVVFNGTMTRRHFDPGGMLVCTETYPLTGQRIAASSLRFKRDVTALLPQGVTLLGLRPVAFRYRAPYGDPAVVRVGLIAEEVAQVFPRAVALGPDGRPYGIAYGVLTGLVLEETEARVRRAVRAGLACLGGLRAVEPRERR